MYTMPCCNCCNKDTIDQALTVLDFGDKGTVGPLEVKLHHKLQPGASINIFAMTSCIFNINLVDECKDILLHIVSRKNNELIFNSCFGGVWGSEERPTENPLEKGNRFSVHIIYQAEGYRIFINGTETHFYKHRNSNDVVNVDISHINIFKFSYTTTIVPDNDICC